ncbi:response regulator [Paenibacillus apiarius]|uniref:Response regulator n=1 Tax=Paenibacillus apiarius TaxID=46240 RepID=A0ABT4DTJ1_9BACL|nr:response regulator [Paenibacillus apiarius]MCY9513916.1 response regulator [Paenibacillus apiarius]MCY9519433.1 response regulator [Paenibacillus apiarius]MCY9552340.1 response regulator [Paenibacillus apiarius]MCY9556188.1 response regulator [Paenibacillus apiarius]MCY9681723.1 response regulator [Paenibacillus apiarius]
MVKKVLVVDDSMFMRHVLGNILERNGYEVIGEAADGSEAVLQYDRLKPDIVMLDITMPVMDGLAALRQIRQQDGQANVVMVSAMGQSHFIRESFCAGAKGFVIKPFQEQHLVETISNLI